MLEPTGADIRLDMGQRSKPFCMAVFVAATVLAACGSEADPLPDSGALAAELQNAHTKASNAVATYQAAAPINEGYKSAAQVATGSLQAEDRQAITAECEPLKATSASSATTRCTASSGNAMGALTVGPAAIEYKLQYDTGRQCFDAQPADARDVSVHWSVDEISTCRSLRADQMETSLVYSETTPSPTTEPADTPDKESADAVDPDQGRNERDWSSRSFDTSCEAVNITTGDISCAKAAAITDAVLSAGADEPDQPITVDGYECYPYPYEIDCSSAKTAFQSHYGTSGLAK